MTGRDLMARDLQRKVHNLTEIVRILLARVENMDIDGDESLDVLLEAYMMLIVKEGLRWSPPHQV